mmetsp:Transcript_123579/g.320963  ORF Transcript_123579/g.320963 Transcript_123579/m.320963 type:complete len:232 (-) Transcript_123579:869-1564(-)
MPSGRSSISAACAHCCDSNERLWSKSATSWRCAALSAHTKSRCVCSNRELRSKEASAESTLPYVDLPMYLEGTNTAATRAARPPAANSMWLVRVATPELSSMCGFCVSSAFMLSDSEFGKQPLLYLAQHHCLRSGHQEVSAFARSKSQSYLSQALPECSQQYPFLACDHPFSQSAMPLLQSYGSLVVALAQPEFLFAQHHPCFSALHASFQSASPSMQSQGSHAFCSCTQQ